MHEEGTDAGTVKECDNLLDAICQCRKLAGGRPAIMTVIDAMGAVVFSEPL